MQTMYIIALFIGLAFVNFTITKRKVRIRHALDQRSKAILQLSYLAKCSALWTFISLLCLLFVIKKLQASGVLVSQFSSFASLFVYFLAAFIIFLLTKQLAKMGFNSQKYIEKLFRKVLKFFSILSGSVTAIILIVILFEALKFFKHIPVHNFLFGLNWNPQAADGIGVECDKTAFGIVPLLAGTAFIAIMAIIIATPIGLMAAIYVYEYGTKRMKNTIKPIVEILAGIPSVVYGYFAVTTVAPILIQLMRRFDVHVDAESSIVPALVIAIMIIPFILSNIYDALASLPQNLRDASLTLGATKSETIVKVVLPSIMPNVISATMLALSRAIGETMIVVMAAGLIANLTINPLEPTTTATVQIVALLTGDQEFNNPKTLAAFAIGLVLFVLTLLLNTITTIISNRFAKKLNI